MARLCLLPTAFGATMLLALPGLTQPSPDWAGVSAMRRPPPPHEAPAAVTAAIPAVTQPRGGPADLLGAAGRALRQGRFGAAGTFLERAETQLLNSGDGATRSDSAAVAAIAQARVAAAGRNRVEMQRHIQAAMAALQPPPGGGFATAGTGAAEIGGTDRPVPDANALPGRPGATATAGTGTHETGETDSSPLHGAWVTLGGGGRR